MTNSTDPQNNELFNMLADYGTTAFNEYYVELGSPAVNDLGALRNAYGHAFSSAWLAYHVNSNAAKAFEIIKEIFTLDQEVENNSLGGTDYERGREIAYKDGSRDMWNNDLGIAYSEAALSNNEDFSSVSRAIFNKIYKFVR